MSTENKSLNFIEQIVTDDLESGKHGGRVHTRFPPEPNGYLHIGHIKAICISFQTAAKFGGKTNLRFDDTNPVTEDTEYVEAIKKDIKWLGFEWEGDALFASDYFDQLYAFAEQLIQKGKAYVDDSTPEEIAEAKGTPSQPATPSPYRDRSVDENLQLFREMRDGLHPEGSKVLRAKIDLHSPNMLMRDPLIYRIKHADHHRTGDKWKIYPMYDFAHGQSDSIEEITHSLCSLEFIHHRPVYDWFISELEIFPSRQIEFARMNVEYMITSKRRLRKLIEMGLVDGWDDPRMPTVSGLRRRGYPPEALVTFCDKAGVAKRENTIEIDLLEACAKEALNKTAPRVMVVLDPIKLVITNYDEGRSEMLTAINNPEDETMGSRKIPFGRELWIERGDYMEDAPKKFFRLSPGRNVRLKNAYIINCEKGVYNDSGNLTEVHATYYPDSKSGEDVSGVKAKGTLHWVSVDHGKPCTVRQYDRLFTVPNPDGDPEKDYLDFYNKESLHTIENAWMEPSLAETKAGSRYQFMRIGYFCTDRDGTVDKPVFNRTVAMRNSWAKKNKK
jgi:glutaminyl-tRNA synthetase